MKTVSRNDPCPCGSGKKYKKCCLGREPQAPQGRFGFLPAAYELDGGSVPAIVCIRRDTGDCHFVLAKVANELEDDLSAADEAAQDLDAAALERRFQENDLAFAEELKNLGYIRIERAGFRDVHVLDDLIKEQQSFQIVADLCRRQAETQIAEQNPPETAQTLERLTSLGYSHESAMEMIAKVLFVENWLVLHHEWPPDLERYAAALNRLPELPTLNDLPKDALR